jgi:hypothetical protein
MLEAGSVRSGCVLSCVLRKSPKANMFVLGPTDFYCIYSLPRFLSATRIHEDSPPIGRTP